MFMLGILIKVWNDWRQGETRFMIQMKDNEVMPAMGETRRWRKPASSAPQAEKRPNP